MNCDCFNDRFHALLDDHQPVCDDPLIQSHSRQCESCRQKLLIWGQIESLRPTPPTKSWVSKSAWLAVPAAIAAVVLGMVLLVPSDRSPTATTTASVGSLGNSGSSPGNGIAERQANAERDRLDPNEWWQSVEPSDWMTQTMPTVRTVRESVAPLSRSFRQAVDLLTFGKAT